MENRILIPILQDGDGVLWAVMTVYFHNDAGPRRHQWGRLVDRSIQKGNLVILAEHTSVLYLHLDRQPPADIESSRKGKAREKEQPAYATLTLLDTWPLVHEADVMDEEGKGLTREHRRIDRISVNVELV